MDVCYLANVRALIQGVAHAGWSGWAPQSLSPRLMARLLSLFFMDNAPAALLAFFCAILAWCASSRSRFFGNTAPLMVFLLLLVLSILFPENGAGAILFATLPFLLLFVAGVFADLIESRWQAPSLAVVFAIVAAQAAYSVAGLVRMYSRLPGS
jgi:hypothetical protein